MPSIFIWKSAETNTSKSSIRYFSGSNWFLEDNEGVARSFLLDDQEVINGSKLNETVLVFNAKEMKKDWVGTELLEVTQLPYKIIKSDEFGTLDMIGNWFRFIPNVAVTDVEKIHEWMATKEEHKKPALDFNSFLIKYDTQTHKKYQKHSNHKNIVKRSRPHKAI